LDLIACHALNEGLGGKHAREHLIGFLRSFAVDHDVACTHGFGQFGFDLFAGFGGGRVCGDGVGSSQSGKGKGDGREGRAVHEEVSLKVEETGGPSDGHGLLPGRYSMGFKRCIDGLNCKISKSKEK
jgi:hypothetical protein